jgi:CTP:molybdopterin cytidylyltransferase MocA
MKRSTDSGDQGPKLPPMIILAGGRSERFGSPKGLAKAGYETYLFSHVYTYAQVGSRCVVVLGYFTDPYIAEIDRVNVCLEKKSFVAEYSVNKSFEIGPFSSIQCGLEALANDLKYGVFVQPVDTGIVTAGLYEELFAASINGTYSVIPEWQGKGGHPVFISADLTTKLTTIDPVLESARLDFQLRAEEEGKVRRLAVANLGILENKNVPTA